MRTVLHKIILSSVMTVFAISTAMAQHGDMWDISPASKGTLPAYKELPEPEEGRFPGLTLERVAYSHLTGFIVNGSWMNLDRYEPSMPIVAPSVYGGDYYTLEYRTKSSGVWKTATDDQDNAQTYSEVVTLVPQITEDTDYRLKMHGGPMDGYYSNEVSAKMPTVNYSVITRQWISQPNFIAPGIKVDGAMIDTEQQDRGTLNYETNRAEYKTLAKFGYDSSCYRHQWYRRNPKTFDMEAIEGATELDYTPTEEDLGYELVDVTTGDDINISFYVASSHGIVSLVIGGSIDYIGNDGFVLNTDYDIPEADKKLILNRYDESTGTDIVEPFGSALEKRKPGQYAIRMSEELYRYGQLSYADEGYYFTFVYKTPVWDDNNEITGYEPWHHFAMIEPQSFYRTLQIKPMLNGEPLATPVDILGKNIDGKLVPIKTLNAEELYEGLMTTDVFRGKYYVKAHQTESTMETYYPNSLVWSDAGILEPEAENWYVDNWQPTCATINLIATPVPLDGSSVIEGTITVKAKARRTRSSEGETYTVYLKDKASGRIIAQTQTDTDGNFRFENVPVGDYIIVPNVDGYKTGTSTPVEVQVTQENQTITNADCTIEEATEAEIFHETTPLAGDAYEDNIVDARDIIEVVNAMMGKPSDKYNKENADANGDGEINVADIVKIISITLGN